MLCRYNVKRKPTACGTLINDCKTYEVSVIDLVNQEFTLLL